MNSDLIITIVLIMVVTTNLLVFLAYLDMKKRLHEFDLFFTASSKETNRRFDKVWTKIHLPKLPSTSGPPG